MSLIFDENHDAEAVIAVTDYSHYPFQALAIDSSKHIRPFWPDLVRLRSPQLPRLVAGNGSAYAISVDSFMRHQDFYLSRGMYAYYMNPMRSVDVDTLDDYNLLKACFEASLNAGH